MRRGRCQGSGHAHRPTYHELRCLTCQREARRARGDEGISLMEVMVALTILLIVILPIGYLLDASVGQATQARQRLAALQLAEQWVEILSNSTPPLVGNSVVTATPETPVDPAGQASAHPTIAGTTFTVTSTYTAQSVNNGTGQSDLCSAGEPPSPNNPAVIVLQVQVSWDRGHFAVTDTTNLQYPQPGVQVDGFIAIQIVDTTQTDVSGNSPATRVESVPVTVTNTTAAGALLVGPGGQPLPATSELNWGKGQTVENLVIVAAGSDSSITFSNRSLGQADLVIDVYGWYG